MTGHFRFLLVDDNPDGLYLLGKTLLRCFPRAIVHNCVEVAAAREALSKHSYTVALVHRARDLDGLRVVAAIRAANRKLPIVHLSWHGSPEESSLAGATKFLSYHAWPQIGNTVADLLPRQVAPATNTLLLAEEKAAQPAAKSIAEEAS